MYFTAIVHLHAACCAWEWVSGGKELWTLQMHPASEWQVRRTHLTAPMARHLFNIRAGLWEDRHALCTLPLEGHVLCRSLVQCMKIWASISGWAVYDWALLAKESLGVNASCVCCSPTGGNAIGGWEVQFLRAPSALDQRESLRLCADW